MHKINKTLVALTLMTHSIVCVSSEVSLSDRLQFGGFARFIGGHLDTPDATFRDYADDVQFLNQSLIALQADARITDNLSFSTQLLAHSSDERESGVEWMYLTYQAKRNLRFRLGKLRTPFFKYSDVIDIGYAYHWITPPQQVYTGSIFSSFEGASANYSLSYAGLNLNIEGYLGSYDGEFLRNGNAIDIEVDRLGGISLDLNAGSFSARASASKADGFDVDLEAFGSLDVLSRGLALAGYQKNANSLAIGGVGRNYQLSASYTTLDYFIAAEWSKTTSESFVLPQIDGAYITAGYNFANYQIHITLAKSDSTYNIAPNNIPSGLDPRLDALSQGYDEVVDSLPLYPLKSMTVGLRRDFLNGVSAKLEATFFDGSPGANSFFAEITDPNFDRKATLYQVGIEWVF